MKDLINNTEKKELRDFGLITAAILVVLFGGLLPWLLAMKFPIWPWLIAIILSLCSLVQPLILRPVYKIWMAIGGLLGWINTRIILGLVFYLVVTPMGLIMRLLGKDPMHRKFIGELSSYRTQSKQHVKQHMEKPF